MVQYRDPISVDGLFEAFSKTRKFFIFDVLNIQHYPFGINYMNNGGNKLKINIPMPKNSLVVGIYNSDFNTFDNKVFDFDYINSLFYNLNTLSDPEIIKFERSNYISSFR